jgi:hypothetical protein
MQRPITLPSSTSSAANSVVVPFLGIVNLSRGGMLRRSVARWLGAAKSFGRP